MNMSMTTTVPSISEHWGRHFGADIFCCGFGSSLLDFDWGMLEGRTVIACNGAITKIPHASYHLWADGCLYKNYWQIPYGEDTTIVLQPSGTRRMLTAYAWAHHNKLRQFSRCKEPGFSHITRESDELWVRTTVMTSAIMLAWKLGAARVYLLGVDGYGPLDAPYYADGTRCPAGFGAVTAVDDGAIGMQGRHHEWVRDMRELAAYLRCQPTAPTVINLNPRSTIDAWPKTARKEVL
jgi:hypothetical protein